MHSIGPVTYNSSPINNKVPYTFTLENNPLILDLCVKKKESPSYTLTYPSPKNSPVYNDTQMHPLHHTKTPQDIAESSEDSEPSKYPYGSDENCSKNNPSVPRPFKAFPRNPLAFTLDIFTKIDTSGMVEPLKETESSYKEFRKKMLASVQDCKGTNLNMRRYQNQDQTNADPSYLERRKKNNEAAKRSREARKAREDEVAIRCAFLEQENIKLKANLATVEMDVERLKRLIFRR